MSDLHVFFFPLMAAGHMIPILDVAKLFAARGVKSTIIATPLNTQYFTNAIQQNRDRPDSAEISLTTVPFPAADVGLPADCECLDRVPSSDLIPNFYKATTLLRNPIEKLLREAVPAVSCLVADGYFPWTNEVAGELGIPRLSFQVTSFFALSVLENLITNKPHNKVGSDDEIFVLPNLPNEIKLTRMQIDENLRSPATEFGRFLKEVVESEKRSYGTIVNTFNELEPDYFNYYTKVLGRKVWQIGPVSLHESRENDPSISENDCIKWLDSKKPNSVIYVCIGSVTNFNVSQLHEIAMGVEASGQKFIWVIRGNKNEKWLPDGFEDRTRDTGVMVTGWAPQVAILNHESTGGFMTHCGWNSMLEGICAGVPMVTWPMSGDQSIKDKLVSEVLRIAVCVRIVTGTYCSGEVQKQDISEAVKGIMVGEEAENMRSRASLLRDSAKKTVQECGSSRSSLNSLIQELSSLHV